jgi:hypothetical protein
MRSWCARHEASKTSEHPVPKSDRQDESIDLRRLISRLVDGKNVWPIPIAPLQTGKTWRGERKGQAPSRGLAMS